MLDEDILIPLFFFLTVIILAIGVPLVRAWVRRSDREAMRPTLPLDSLERLERMEVTLDAVALEIERITENQRFTTRLLSEARPGEPLLREPAAAPQRSAREDGP